MKAKTKRFTVLASAAAALALTAALAAPLAAAADTLVSDEYRIRSCSGVASFSYFIDEENGLHFAGSNGYGQAGDGLKGGNYTMPRDVLDNVQAVAAGKAGYALALRTDGTLWGWGNNQYAQLGLGTEYNNDAETNCVLQPTELEFEGKAVQLALGDAFTVVLTESGEVYTCGRASYGQTGLSGLGELSRTSVVGTLTKIDQSAFGGKRIAQVEAASNTGFALAEDGSLYVWGANDYGILGGGSTDVNIIYETPVQVEFSEAIEKVSAEAMTVLILTESGKVYGWGNNGNRQLGVADLTDVSVAQPTEIDAFYDEDGAPVAAEITDIACGGTANFFLSSEGDVFAVGAAGTGQAGITISESKYLNHPCTVDSNVVLPMRIAFYQPLNIEEESKKEGYTSASPVDASTPVDVNIVQFVNSCGDRTFVLDENGDMWSWGINLYGMTCSGEATASFNAHPVRSTLFRDKNYDVGYTQKNYMLKPAIVMGCVVALAVVLFVWAEVKKRRTMRLIREENRNLEKSKARTY